MIHPFNDTDWNPGLDARRAFGKSLALGFPILAAVFSFSLWWKTGHGSSWLLWLGVVGAGAGAFFWLVPQAAKPAYLLWYFVAGCLGAVVSHLLLALVFYLVVTPVGLLLRCFGKDPMRRRFDPAARTYWLEAEKITDHRRYFRQF